MEAPANSDIIGPHRVFEKHMGETNCHPPVCSRHHIHTVGIWRQALESFIRFPALPQHPHAGWNGIIKALKDHTVLSRQQINELLWSKLPIDYTEEQKLRKIGNLLTKMRKNKEIQTDENRLWHLSEQNEILSEFK